jgi:hypothetical protein
MKIRTRLSSGEFGSKVLEISATCKFSKFCWCDLAFSDTSSSLICFCRLTAGSSLELNP